MTQDRGSYDCKNPRDIPTINQAWWTVQRNSIAAPCRDVVDFADFKLHEDSLRSAVLRKLRNYDQMPVYVEFWKAPRSNGVCRLVSLPDLVTRVSLQSIGLAMTEKLNAKLSDCVISRPGPLRSTAFVDGWYGQWSQYFSRILRLKKKSKYLVATDFANFFDSVSLVALRHLLEKEGIPRTQVKSVCGMLQSSSYMNWKESSVGVGIPQLYDDGALLVGNFYLSEFDEKASALLSPERYARWLDDFIFGAHSHGEANSFIANLSVAARDLGLNLNPYKTRLLASVDLERTYLLLEEHRKLDSLEIEVVLRNGPKSRTEAKESFIALLDHVRSRVGVGLGELLLRRIYRLGSMLDSPHLLPFVVTDLVRYPNSASAICQYLGSVSWNDKIPDLISEYLQQPENTYQTVEISLLLSLFHRHLNPGAKKYVAKLASAIVSRRLIVKSSSSLGIAAVLLQRFASKGEAARSLSPLAKSLITIPSRHAQRFIFTALCGVLSPSIIRNVIQKKESTAELQQLFSFLESKDFDLNEFWENQTCLSFPDMHLRRSVES